MDFGLSEEQQAVREAAERFARERLAPGYAARDGAGLLDRALIREMGALGFLAPELPEALGGLGLDRLTSGLAMEALAAGDFNMAYVPLLASLNGQIVAEHAVPEVAAEWVPRICAGEAMVALALTEPRGGSDAGNLQLSMRRDGNDWILDGEKTSISCAEQADAAVVFARSGRPDQGAAGVSAILVPLDRPGIARTRFEDLGQRAVGRGSIFFDAVRVPGRYLLGAEGEGFRQVMQGFDFSRALIGLQCLAVATASLEETWAYVAGREAFGRPLSAFQGVSHRLAELDTQLQAARLLCLKALWLKDRGLPHTAEAAMCKWWAPKLAFEAVQACLLFHGHAGYSRELPYEQRLRDLLGLQIGDGTAEIMKTIVARQRVGRQAVPN
ncbi:cyclohexanecarboxyl-CoA dehydrogenase [Tistlia consotensis]|uniref:Cyclohexanecarboxyl-CoA dehydrogenase n=1 Tax=Tistlia consotensis USBA 355 TaxID=560819 RepID=A0A1Y6B6M5_9PROT|nr:cyclohexanecarboxyl-CoA dehydrogenase [Tistlia consotensis]SME90938.1 cyclohexanecarboxyl-CoA dehydrogenase [Tistlia consotensis USBA 355]SNR27017.1 cyclohexanecarboxyl-CoA dehydrogenase [Tistlia consotensis]